MSETSPQAGDGVRFSIRYDAPGSTKHNLWMTGAGEVVISADRGTFRFSGRNRKLISRTDVVHALPVEAIWNARRWGRLVAFTTNAMNPKQPRATFVFFCASEAEAAEVLRWLPQRIDAEYAGELEFFEKLAELPAAEHWSRSVTGGLIFANVAVFVVLGLFFDAGWLTTKNADVYIRFGANNGAATTGGEWWRLATSMFMHYGAIHLAFNMWALFNLGALLEKLTGRALFGMIYLAGGLGGGFASIFWNRDETWSAGASGAVFGLMGASLAYVLRQRGAIPPTIFKPMVKSSLFFLGYNLIFGLSHPSIDNAAHIGGFVVGFAMSWLTALPLERERREKLLAARLWLAGALTAVLVAAGVAGTPRFDYRWSEELRWGDLVEPFALHEERLADRHREFRERYSENRDNAEAFAVFLERDFLPYYEMMAAALEELPLTPGLRTDRRRNAFQKFIDARREGTRHLLNAIRHEDATALKLYEASERAAAAALETLPK